MPHSTQGVIALMGSGEMAPSMVEAHKYAMSLARGSLKAAFLDTPAGFQLNADLLSEKAVEYFRERLNTPLEIASFKSVEGVTPEQVQAVVRLLRDASYIFAGPGSPTYALRNWAHSPVRDALFHTLAHGGCLTFASAAALTIGRYTLPVYEIYKVGEALHWVDGLDVLGHSGLEVCIIPHWNNTSGGDHDTRFCFMGEPRWRVLVEQLPASTVILGIDEHTACILRLEAGVCEVRGVGQVTLLNGAKQHIFTGGDSFALDLLRSAEAAPSTPARQGPVSPLSAQSAWEEIRARHNNLLQQARPAPDEVAGYIYSLMALMASARATDDQVTAGQAEQALREALVDLVAQLGGSMSDVDALIDPYLRLLIDLRLSFRQDKQWDQADLIRSRLTNLGIVLEDGPAGTTWRRSA